MLRWEPDGPVGLQPGCRSGPFCIPLPKPVCLKAASKVSTSQGASGAPRAGGGNERPSPEPPRGLLPCQLLDSSLLVSRSGRKEASVVSVILRHQVCGDLSHQPQKTHTARKLGLNLGYWPWSLPAWLESCSIAYRLLIL